MDKRLKILIVIDVLRYGGAQKIAINLGKALSEYGNDVKLYCYAGQTGEAHLPSGIQVIKGKPFVKNRFIRHLIKIFHIRKQLKETDYDIVITFMTYPSILTVMASVGLQNKVIVCERGDPHSYKGFIKYVGFRIIQRADGAVFQTNGARECFSGHLYEVGTVIPNPVIDKGFTRRVIDERNNTIAFVGRFELRQKRQDLMLKAFSLIHRKKPQVKLAFYGDGDDTIIVKELASRLNLTDYVIFAGKCNEIERVLRDSRMFVMTSDYEGIPNALIEAMSVGIPCVATDCSPGGARLLIEDHVNGRIVDKGDVIGIANACLEILDNPEVGEIYGVEAQKVRNRFREGDIYKQWYNYILEVYNG